MTLNLLDQLDQMDPGAAASNGAVLLLRAELRSDFRILNAKIDQMALSMDSRFNQGESRFDRIESRLDRVESKLDRIDGSLKAVTEQVALLVEHLIPTAR